MPKEYIVVPYSGQRQVFEMPSGYDRSIVYHMWGGGGGAGGASTSRMGGNGGAGDYTTGTFAANPGELVELDVGGGGDQGAEIKSSQKLLSVNLRGANSRGGGPAAAWGSVQVSGPVGTPVYSGDPYPSQTWNNWGAFLNRYGVIDQRNDFASRTYTLEWDVYLPWAGTYELTWAVDNKVKISLDDQVLLDNTNVPGLGPTSFFQSSARLSFAVSEAGRGKRRLTAEVVNAGTSASGNPTGVAIVITNRMPWSGWTAAKNFGSIAPTIDFQFQNGGIPVWHSRLPREISEIQSRVQLIQAPLVEFYQPPDPDTTLLSGATGANRTLAQICRSSWNSVGAEGSYDWSFSSRNFVFVSADNNWGADDFERFGLSRSDVTVLQRPVRIKIKGRADQVMDLGYYRFQRGQDWSFANYSILAGGAQGLPGFVQQDNVPGAWVSRLKVNDNKSLRNSFDVSYEIPVPAANEIYIAGFNDVSIIAPLGTPTGGNMGSNDLEITTESTAGNQVWAGGRGGASRIGLGQRTNLVRTEITGLVARWQGDTGSGTFQDTQEPVATTRLVNAVVEDLPGAGSVPGAPPGFTVPAIKVNTAGQKLGYAQSPGTVTKLQLTASKGTNITCEAWVYRSGPGSNPVFGGIIVNKDPVFEVGIDATGRVIVAVDWGVGQDVNLPGGGWLIPPPGTAIVPLNTATHVAAVIDGTELRIYLNGTLAWTRTGIERARVVSDSNWWIGSRTNQQQQWQGWIGDVRIWNVARTQQEIQDNRFVLNTTTAAAGNQIYLIDLDSANSYQLATTANNAAFSPPQLSVAKYDTFGNPPNTKVAARLTAPPNGAERVCAFGYPTTSTLGTRRYVRTITSTQRYALAEAQALTYWFNRADVKNWGDPPDPTDREGSEDLKLEASTDGVNWLQLDLVPSTSAFYQSGQWYQRSIQVPDRFKTGTWLVRFSQTGACTPDQPRDNWAVTSLEAIVAGSQTNDYYGGYGGQIGTGKILGGGGGGGGASLLLLTDSKGATNIISVAAGGGGGGGASFNANGGSASNEHRANRLNAPAGQRGNSTTESGGGGGAGGGGNVGGLGGTAGATAQGGSGGFAGSSSSVGRSVQGQGLNPAEVNYAYYIPGAGAGGAGITTPDVVPSFIASLGQSTVPVGTTFQYEGTPYVPVTWPTWGTFLNTYGVAQGDRGAQGTFTLNYQVWLPDPGTYTLRASVDNNATVTINGQKLLTIAESTIASPAQTTFTANGEATLTVVIQYTNLFIGTPATNPGGVAATISLPGSSTPIWSTRFAPQVRVQEQLVSNPGYAGTPAKFMEDHGVRSNRPDQREFTRSYRFFVPTAGRYLVRAGVFGTGSVEIDGGSVINMAGNNPPEYWYVNGATATPSLQAGFRTVRYTSNSPTDDSSIAVTISPVGSPEQLLFDSARPPLVGGSPNGNNGLIVLEMQNLTSYVDADIRTAQGWTRKVAAAWVKQSGVWSPIVGTWIKINGAWRAAGSKTFLLLQKLTTLFGGPTLP